MNQITAATLSAADAAAIDNELMKGNYGFSVDQLMELAGLAVAEATLDSFQKLRKTYYKPASQNTSSIDGKTNSATVLVVVGPGNNGGDALVAARHLLDAGLHVSVLMPQQPAPDHVSSRQYNILRKYTGPNGSKARFVIPFGTRPNLMQHLKPSDTFDIMIDGVFGYSQRGVAKEPFDSTLLFMKVLQERCQEGMITVAIDIASGYPIDGDHNIDDIQRFAEMGHGIIPDVFVSLTGVKLSTAKLCNLKPCRMYQGDEDPMDPEDDGQFPFQPAFLHYLGGRFIPDELKKKFRIPPYDAYKTLIDWPSSENDSPMKQIADVSHIRFNHCS